MKIITFHKRLQLMLWNYEEFNDYYSWETSYEAGMEIIVYCIRLPGASYESSYERVKLPTTFYRQVHRKFAILGLRNYSSLG